MTQDFRQGGAEPDTGDRGPDHIAGFVGLLEVLSCVFRNRSLRAARRLPSGWGPGRQPRTAATTDGVTVAGVASPSEVGVERGER